MGHRAGEVERAEGGILGLQRAGHEQQAVWAARAAGRQCRQGGQSGRSGGGSGDWPGLAGRHPAGEAEVRGAVAEFGVDAQQGGGRHGDRQIKAAQETGGGGSRQVRHLGGERGIRQPVGEVVEYQAIDGGQQATDRLALVQQPAKGSEQPVRDRRIVEVTVKGQVGAAQRPAAAGLRDDLAPGARAGGAARRHIQAQ